MARTVLKDKPIAISGASSGIGRATAIACAAAGMPVALGARRTDRLAELAETIRSRGGRAVALPLDVKDPGACEEFIAKSVEAFGPLYSVYANAGYGLELPMHKMSDAQIRDIFETNFFGTLSLVRPAVARMLSQPAGGGIRGHVLICSSCLAKMTLPSYGAYSATKAAQCHVGRAMRLELEPLGIRVSTVHPIGTRTEFFEQSKKNSDAVALVSHSPGWFMQDAEYVAARTVACLQRPVPEVWTGLKGLIVRLGMAVNTLMPSMADLTTRRMVR